MIMSLLCPASLTAEPIQWPETVTPVKPGDPVLEPMGCFVKDDLHKLRVGIELCETYRLEAEELREVAKDATKPPSFLESRWFYLTLGVVVGGLATVAHTF